MNLHVHCAAVRPSAQASASLAAVAAEAEALPLPRVPLVPGESIHPQDPAP